MKFSLIAAVVLLALAQGSFAQDAADLERIGQYLEEMKTKMIKDLTDFINNQDLQNQAQTFLQDSRAQLEPLVSKVQEQLKTVATNVEEQIRPMANNMQAQIQPQIDNLYKTVETMVEKMKEQPIAN